MQLHIIYIHLQKFNNYIMKKLTGILSLAVFFALSSCGEAPKETDTEQEAQELMENMEESMEEAAEEVEESTEMAADSIEAAADSVEVEMKGE